MQTILILANSSGGLYDFRNELVLRLLTEYRVVASLPDTVRTSQLEAEGVEVMETPINRRGVNPIEDFKLLLNYRKLLKQVKPDLVLTYTIKPNIYGGICCRMAHIPYITTITGLGSTFQKKGLLLQLIVRLYQTGLRKARCVFFQNAQNQEIFARHHIKGQKSRLVSGSGVDLQRHTIEPYPSDTDDTHFLYVGRMMREKGIEEYLEAARQLHSPEVKFELLGYCDEDYQELLDSYEAQGFVKQLGFDPEVHSYLKKASALVLPTYHEGMSNVLMEASATGRPVIASAISGCKEIFDEGKTGFGFKPQDTEDLVRALKEFLKLSAAEREAMGKSARTKMEAQFDRRKVAEAYKQEIDAILHLQTG